MNKKSKKLLTKTGAAVGALGVLYVMPVVSAFWIVCGALDFSRYEGEGGRLAFKRYFFGNGLLTWFLSPLNLLFDLISKPNKGVYALDDFPKPYRDEIEQVLSTIKDNKEKIVADIEKVERKKARGMYVFRWYGDKHVQNIEGLNGQYDYIQTIAISTFDAGESTTWHYGPLRASIRVLYNLDPVEKAEVFIECQGKKHYWRDEPFYAFDDTLFHRSINESTVDRHAVFVDIIRPTYARGALVFAMSVVGALLKSQKNLFYKNWEMH